MSVHRTSSPPPRIVALQIKLPCATPEELRREHGHELASGTFFIRTRKPKPLKTPIRFELRLEGGEPVLRGLGVVIESQLDPAQGQAGMRLQLRGLDAASHIFLQSLGLRSSLPTIRAQLTGDDESRRYLKGAQEVIEASTARSEQGRPHTTGVDARELPKAIPPPAHLISGVRQAKQAEAPPSTGDAAPIQRKSDAPRATSSPPAVGDVAQASPKNDAPPAIPSKPSQPPAAPQPAPTASKPPRLSNPPRSGPVVGIDFGTTHTTAAWCADDVAQIMNSPEGESRLQSLFGVDSRGLPLVGAEARKAVLQSPQNAVRNGRRMLGRSAVSDAAQEMQKALPFTIVSGRHGQVAASLAGHPFAMEDVASRLIGETSGWAEARIGRPVGRAVLTVPGAATVTQRLAAREAAELSGLAVERLIPEPVAIALAYASNRDANQKLAVVRFGGGSFDVAVLEQRGRTGLELLALGGDTLIGGNDLDQLLMNVLLKQFEEEQGSTFSDNPILVQRFADAAEQAKIALSTRDVFNVGMPYLRVTPNYAVDFDTSVTRAALEQLAAPLIDRAVEVTNDVLASLKLRSSDIGEVIIAGGQSRMPLFLARMKEIFGREPARGVNIEESAALGAALLAHRIQVKTLDGLQLDVLPASIGVGLPGGACHKLFERHQRPPRTVTHTVTSHSTIPDDVEVSFFQGENKRALENEFIGSVRVPNLAPGAKAQLSLELTQDGLLSVSLAQADGSHLPLVLNLGRSTEELRTALGDKGEAAGRRGRMWTAVRGLLSRKKKPAP